MKRFAMCVGLFVFGCLGLIAYNMEPARTSMTPIQYQTSMIKPPFHDPDIERLSHLVADTPEQLEKMLHMHEATGGKREEWIAYWTKKALELNALNAQKGTPR